MLRNQDNLGDFVAGRARRRTRVTNSGVEVQFSFLFLMLSHVPGCPLQIPGQIPGTTELAGMTAFTSFLKNSS